ncbi:MAG: DnaJ domain-containing protein [Armatimonadetes bacterium]|nr:DnaJ domain-containing protein [Armatimonadota bacterium]
MKIVYTKTVRNWPTNKPPCDARKWSQFKPNKLRGATARVIEEVKRFSHGYDHWRTTKLTFYCKADLNQDGTFSDNSNIYADPRVVVCFDLDGVDYTIPCDAFVTSAWNLCAIAKTIEGLRANERYGVLTLKQMMEGVAELPQVSSALRPSWWTVLDIDRNAKRADIEAQYRKLVGKRHPDAGGTDTEWHELQEAIRTAREVCVE